MDYLNDQTTASSFSVSLWQEEKLLGWYRPKHLYPEGMLLNGTLEKLHDNSIVTVWIELKKHGVYRFHQLKALVHQQPDATELIWVNQNADIPGLMPHIAFPPAGDHLAAGARSGMSDAVGQ